MSDVIKQRDLEIIRSGVERCLRGDVSGHGMEHVRRVVKLTSSMADSLGDEVRKDIAVATALLHDVDDYKLVGGVKNADKLLNATDILNDTSISLELQAEIKDNIKHMGYSKALKGVRPKTLEGMVVSDADMCDAIGSIGVVRSLMYTLSDKGSGNVFNPDIWPNISITAEEYNGSGSTHSTDGFINHFFEKLLNLSGMMMTAPGRDEAVRRDEAMVVFLREFFLDESASEWSELLEDFIGQRDRDLAED